MESRCWHLEDRKVRRERDRLRFELGIRKTLPPLSYYNLSAEQARVADDRALKAIALARTGRI